MRRFAAPVARAGVGSCRSELTPVLMVLTLMPFCRISARGAYSEAAAFDLIALMFRRFPCSTHLVWPNFI